MSFDRRGLALATLLLLAAPAQGFALVGPVAPLPSAELVPGAVRGPLLPAEEDQRRVDVLLTGGADGALYVVIVAPASFKIAAAEGDADMALVDKGTFEDGNALAGRDYAKFLGVHTAVDATRLALTVEARSLLGDGTYDFEISVCQPGVDGACTSEEAQQVPLVVDSLPPLFDAFAAVDAVTGSALHTQGRVLLSWSAGPDVAQWHVNESPILADSPDWRASAPGAYVFAGADGTLTLHAAVRDGVG
ncbi:MAG TPA: hypothetical protein VM582_01830, partial [Candidatus Thermoplasmatota archaeon]|nr:hypothetical protein [Candidatus Thermoplasmatota archaeon]